MILWCYAHRFCLELLGLMIMPDFFPVEFTIYRNSWHNCHKSPKILGTNVIQACHTSSGKSKMIRLKVIVNNAS